MIRINLLGEKKVTSGIYLAQLLVFACCILLTFGIIIEFHAAKSAELGVLSRKKTSLENQVAKLREKTKAVESLEKNKKLLAEKLLTIAKLKAKKQGPVRLLDNLTQTTPERAWVTSVSQKGEDFEIKGISLDNQTVAKFMESLSKSKYFRKVDFKGSKQYIKEGVKLQQFGLVANLASMLEVNAQGSGTNEPKGTQP